MALYGIAKIGSGVLERSTDADAELLVRALRFFQLFSRLEKVDRDPVQGAVRHASLPINCTCKFALKASTWVREHLLRITTPPVESSYTK